MFFKCLTVGMRSLFSYRARYDVIKFSNCHTEERSETTLNRWIKGKRYNEDRPKLHSDVLPFVVIFSEVKKAV